MLKCPHALQAAPPAEDAEADPFGLEQIIQKQEAPKCVSPPP